MDERRREVFRREPIEIDLGGRVVFVAPIPWEQRNDFGNAVLKQYVDLTNDAVSIYTDPDSGLPQLEAKLAERYSDPRQLLQLGLDGEAFTVAYSDALYSNQITALLMAICEVNDLNQLLAIVDPKRTAQMTPGGIDSLIASAMIVSPQTESGQDSSSPESIEAPSSSLPQMSSTPS